MDNPLKINTCSGTISLARELENDSARIYQKFSLIYKKGEVLFQSYAEENGKYILQVERSYYGVITDALEGCFSFDLNPDDYKIKKISIREMKSIDVLKEALAIEEKILKFYQTAADQSKSLMADIPRAFTLVAKKRTERIKKLKALLAQEK